MNSHMITVSLATLKLFWNSKISEKKICKLYFNSWYRNIDFCKYTLSISMNYYVNRVSSFNINSIYVMHWLHYISSLNKKISCLHYTLNIKDKFRIIYTKLFLPQSLLYWKLHYLSTIVCCIISIYLITNEMILFLIL